MEDFMRYACRLQVRVLWQISCSDFWSFSIQYRAVAWVTKTGGDALSSPIRPISCWFGWWSSSTQWRWFYAWCRQICCFSLSFQIDCNCEKLHTEYCLKCCSLGYERQKFPNKLFLTFQKYAKPVMKQIHLQVYAARLRRLVAQHYWPERTKPRTLWLYNKILESRKNILSQLVKAAKRKVSTLRLIQLLFGPYVSLQKIRLCIGLRLPGV